MMADIAADAFHRVQRFSTDWHANSFAGSTVRKVTRGMWALDLLNDTILIALLPSLVMLVGSTVLLGWYWPVMGLVVAVGSLVYIGADGGAVARLRRAGGRLANSWDTKLGGALADAVSCNAVVKAFGAEAREDARLRHGRRQMARPHAPHLGARHDQRHHAGRRRCWCCARRSSALRCCCGRSGQASAGDITFVLTTFFLLQGYLRDVGMHIRNLQRSVNDMEELVDIHAAAARRRGPRRAPGRSRIGDGGIDFDNVTFHYGSHRTPLYRDFSVTIAPGERVGLVGHSGSGKTTFVKLIQRLYDVNERPHPDRRPGHRRGRRRRRCARRSPSCSRSRSCSTARWPRTSPMAGRAPARPRSSRRRGWPARTTSSSACRRATRRWSASAASSCRAASASAWRSPAPSWPMRRS